MEALGVSAEKIVVYDHSNFHVYIDFKPFIKQCKRHMFETKLFKDKLIYDTLSVLNQDTIYLSHYSSFQIENIGYPVFDRYKFILSNLLEKGKVQLLKNTKNEGLQEMESYTMVKHYIDDTETERDFIFADGSTFLKVLYVIIEVDW